MVTIRLSLDLKTVTWRQRHCQSAKLSHLLVDNTAKCRTIYLGRKNAGYTYKMWDFYPAKVGTVKVLVYNPLNVSSHCDALAKRTNVA